MEQYKMLRQNLMQAVFEVFEKMYFIFLEPVEKEAPGQNFSAVEIEFSGALSGIITARFPRDLAMIMAENALGMDHEEISDQILADCRKECLNMLCGDFLQKHDAQKLFHMSLPKDVKEGGRTENGDRRQAEKVDLNFESDHIPLHVEMVVYEPQG